MTIVKESTARRPEMKPPVKRQPEVVAVDPEGGAGPRNELLEWIKSLAIAVVLFFVIRTFLVQAYTIPSGSMENTLLVGDYLMANNAVFGAKIPFTELRVPAFREPQHGDVVVFRPTYNDPVIDVVKRVIGEPGDTIQMIDRVVYRNGERLEEPYTDLDYFPDEPLQRFGPAGYDWHLAALPAGVDQEAYRPTRDNWGPLVVPEGNYLLLGDNRDQSLDSRYMGFIPRQVIRGKAMFIYYSIDPEPDRPFPHFLTAARWGRLGQMLR
jgi:signal peptidase I